MIREGEGNERGRREKEGKGKNTRKGERNEGRIKEL